MRMWAAISAPHHRLIGDVLSVQGGGVRGVCVDFMRVHCRTAVVASISGIGTAYANVQCSETHAKRTGKDIGGAQ